jgi:hypothetical protein
MKLKHLFFQTDIQLIYQFEEYVKNFLYRRSMILFEDNFRRWKS